MKWYSKLILAIIIIGVLPYFIITLAIIKSFFSSGGKLSDVFGSLSSEISWYLFLLGIPIIIFVVYRCIIKGEDCIGM